MNRERVRVRLREVLGDGAANLDALLHASGAETLRATSRDAADVERDLRSATGPERTRLFDRLLALRVLEETVAWDAMGPNASLPEDPSPLALLQAMRERTALALIVRAARDCGSLLVEAGGARVVLPPLAGGATLAVHLPGANDAREVFVLRGEERWTLPVDAPAR